MYLILMISGSKNFVFTTNRGISGGSRAVVDGDPHFYIVGGSDIYVVDLSANPVTIKSFELHTALTKAAVAILDGSHNINYICLERTFNTRQALQINASFIRLLAVTKRDASTNQRVEKNSQHKP